MTSRKQAPQGYNYASDFLSKIVTIGALVFHEKIVLYLQTYFIQLLTRVAFAIILRISELFNMRLTYVKVLVRVISIIKVLFPVVNICLCGQLLVTYSLEKGVRK